MCEVDSAKSDSGVSDDEYEEIKELERKLLNTRKKHVNINNRQTAEKKTNNRSLVSNLLRN